MYSLINYLIEASLGLAIILLGYRILLKKETNFQFRRLFLLLGMVTVLSFPLIKLENDTMPVLVSSNFAESLVIPEIQYNVQPARTDLPAQMEIWEILFYVYLTGVTGMSALFLVRLLKLGLLIYGNPSNRHADKYIIVEVHTSTPAFSFFNHIFFNPTYLLTYSDSEREQILRHEMAHADDWHSADILLAEIIKIVFWFNPAIYYLKKELVAIHEFQADARVLLCENPDRYCHLLAKMNLQHVSFTLSHHFFQSLILQRIAMIKSTKHTLKAWKLAACIPVAALLFITVACQDQVMKDTLANNKTLTQMSEYPPEVQAEIQKLKEKNPQAKFTYVEGEQGEVKNTLGKMKDTQVVLHTFSFKERGITGVLLQDISTYAENMKTVDEIFVVVEEAATPEGGINGLYQHIRENLQYPAEARARNIQGKVFIAFVVEKDGSLSDFQIMKGIGGGCDEQAMRVLQSSPKWKPGKQNGRAVRQRMSLPIAFSLGNGTESNSTSTTSTASVIPEPPASVDYKLDIRSHKITENGESFMTGTVKDQDGNPLPGVNILVKNTTTGTTTDMQGSFKIRLSDTKGSLVFSFVGFKSNELVYAF